MTTVFRSCLPRHYSDTHQTISNEDFSYQTNSIISLNNHEFSNNSCTMNCISNNELNISEQEQQIDLLPSSKQTKIFRNNTKITKTRGPRYSRNHEQRQSLLTRFVNTIFGYNPSYIISNKKKRTKKSILPSKSMIEKQFENNEQTLHKFLTVLTQMESNTQSKANSPRATSNENHKNNYLSIDQEQARNNNRMEDTSSSHSSNTYCHKLNAKHNHRSKHYNNNRLSKKSSYYNRKRSFEENTISLSSVNSHSSLQSPSYMIRRKMIDNQQQTQIYPTKINVGTSTQLNHTNDTILSESSWLDVMREDQTTIDAWARIRRRLKPNQQKDILK